ncbi:MAG: GNAT family N-acetyltransferase, partial [Myxococcales bacterium]|nr:GNAT family N-acetyltransferase [Myxococcales bacterium]
PWHFVELNEIYVSPEHRKRGVARALCTELAHRARESGARAIRLTVRHFNTEALAAYQALGYRPLQHRLELRLDTPS